MVQINFIRLHNIDKRLYKRSILKIFDHFTYYKDSEMRKQFHLWTINIYPTNDLEDNSKFWSGLIDNDAQTNKDIPHGNTGQFVINMFIYDQKGDMAHRMNMFAFSRESAHAVMMMYWSTKRKDMFVHYVHSVEKRKLVKTFKFWWLNRSIRFVKRITMTVLDISNRTNTKREDKGFSPFQF